MKEVPEVGTRIYVYGERFGYTVQARDERYAVCTRPHFKTVMYFVLDIVEQVRGTENLVLCMGATTPRLCREMLARIASGKSEISHRNRVRLDLIEVP